jgi:hypothetical protein
VGAWSFFNFSISLTSITGPGDSGSWVIDSANGKLYGQIAAGGPGSRAAYVVAAQRIAQDIKSRFGSPFLLPQSSPSPTDSNVLQELPCESPRTAEPIEKLRTPESPAEICGNVVGGSRRQLRIKPSLEVIPYSQFSSRRMPSLGQSSSSLRGSFWFEGRKAFSLFSPRSRSISSMPLSLADNTAFMKLEVPKDTFRSVMCPSACHVTFLCKNRATIVRLGNEGTWMANHKPIKIETNARTQSISCPDNWEWDFASIAGGYLILRSKRPGGKERKVSNYVFVSTCLIAVLGLPV